MIDTNTIVSMTEANQNFSLVTRIVDQYGTAVIFKNNKPRYRIVEIVDTEDIETASDEDVLAVSKKLLKRNSAVYESEPKGRRRGAAARRGNFFDSGGKRFERILTLPLSFLNRFIVKEIKTFVMSQPFWNR